MQHGQDHAQVLAHAAQGEAAFGVGRRRLWPGRKVAELDPRKTDAVALLNGRPRPARRAGKFHQRDRDHDVGDRSAPNVEEPSANDLLGPKRDLGAWLRGVGVEGSPAGAVAGRDRYRGEQVVPCRCGSRRVETKLS
jgi:hypothetical protein